MDEEPREELKKEYIAKIIVLLNNCYDIELFDLIVKLLQRSYLIRLIE